MNNKQIEFIAVHIRELDNSKTKNFSVLMKLAKSSFKKIFDLQDAKTNIIFQYLMVSQFKRVNNQLLEDSSVGLKDKNKYLVNLKQLERMSKYNQYFVNLESNTRIKIHHKNSLLTIFNLVGLHSNLEKYFNVISMPEKKFNRLINSTSRRIKLKRQNQLIMDESNTNKINRKRQESYIVLQDINKLLGNKNYNKSLSVFPNNLKRNNSSFQDYKLFRRNNNMSRCGTLLSNPSFDLFQCKEKGIRFLPNYFHVRFDGKKKETVVGLNSLEKIFKMGKNIIRSEIIYNDQRLLNITKGLRINPKEIDQIEKVIIYNELSLCFALTFHKQFTLKRVIELKFRSLYKIFDLANEDKFKININLRTKNNDSLIFHFRKQRPIFKSGIRSPLNKKVTFSNFKSPDRIRRNLGEEFNFNKNNNDINNFDIQDELTHNKDFVIENTDVFNDEIEVTSEEEKKIIIDKFDEDDNILNEKREFNETNEFISFTNIKKISNIKNRDFLGMERIRENIFPDQISFKEIYKLGKYNLFILESASINNIDQLPQINKNSLNLCNMSQNFINKLDIKLETYPSLLGFEEVPHYSLGSETNFLNTFLKLYREKTIHETWNKYKNNIKMIQDNISSDINLLNSVLSFNQRKINVSKNIIGNVQNSMKSTNIKIDHLADIINIKEIKLENDEKPAINDLIETDKEFINSLMNLPKVTSRYNFHLNNLNASKKINYVVENEKLIPHINFRISDRIDLNEIIRKNSKIN